MRSCIFTGELPIDEALTSVDSNDISIADELQRLSIAGDAEPGSMTARAFLELHVEQGPILEAEKLQIGIVEGVQGIS